MAIVTIKECTDYNTDNLIKTINKGMGEIGGWDSFTKPGMKVLLKVNLIGPKSSDSGAVTHCEFVRAITRILKQRGCEVWIGDSSGGAIAGIAPTARSFEVSGLSHVAKQEGALIKNFDKEGVVEVSSTIEGEDKMYLAKPIFDADLVINLPKMKTHSAGIYTGAVKNVFGLIPGLKKAYYHKIAPNPGDLGKILADIHKATNIQLHIMDGIIAMEGEGPTAGQPYAAHKILISTDPLALDVVASKMIGINLDEIPILQSSVERGIGESNLNKIKVTGDYQSPPRLNNYKLPKRYKSTKKRNYKALIKVIDFLRARPTINLKHCKNCNMCVESCPVEAIDKKSKSIDYSKCIECMCCHELCTYKAVILKRDNILASIMMKFSGGQYK